ncbi:hypothetical protein [Streptomyces sp. NPDC001389]|uniref:hypothetical protein n=1 Tax=unclassified Streptomyces TaxID=2593676 RepID=UPI0036B49003
MGHPADGNGPEAVEDVLRAETANGGIARLRWYHFCPGIPTEIGDRLGLPLRADGYHVWHQAPAGCPASPSGVLAQVGEGVLDSAVERGVGVTECTGDRVGIYPRFVYY